MSNDIKISMAYLIGSLMFSFAVAETLRDFIGFVGTFLIIYAFVGFK